MGWSLSHVFPHPTQAAASALVAAGRALYLSNAYEYKCAYMLRIIELDAYAEAGKSFAEAIAAASKDTLLGRVLPKISKFPTVSEAEVALLDRAREARNFIAHEGALIGHVYNVSDAFVADHLARLREEVLHLARGDNIVSGWVFEVQEKDFPPKRLSEQYASLVEAFVFGH